MHRSERQLGFALIKRKFSALTYLSAPGATHGTKALSPGGKRYSLHTFFVVYTCVNSSTSSIARLVRCNLVVGVPVCVDAEVVLVGGV